jgi:FMN phosphatase YigB (HAD superfamily)
MTRYTLKGLLGTFLLVSCISAKIVESDQIGSVLTYIDGQKTLVIFDIDNTLAEPDNPHGVGSDQWYTQHVERLIAAGVDPKLAWRLAAPFYFEIQLDSNFKLRPLEVSTINVVRTAQEKADKVIVLTARSYHLIDKTIEMLNEIGIDFLTNAFKADFLFDAVPGQYTRGVFFCGPGDKGKSLVQLFKKINYWPERVILIDDKYKNLQSVEQAMNLLGIDFVGIRYSRLDQKVKEFKLRSELLAYYP